MALNWERRRIDTPETPAVFDNHVLAQIPAGHTLKRTIVSWVVFFSNSDTRNTDFFLAMGLWWSIQVTYGEPPGFPIDPAKDDPNTTDMLDWGVTKQGLVGGPEQLWTTTGNFTNQMGYVDTSAQRRTFTYPSIVWFAWGIPLSPAFEFEGFSTMAASSVLIDDHDMPV